MKTTKRNVTAALADLDRRIPEAIFLQQQIEEFAARLAAEKTAIRESLAEANIRHHTSEGCEALLVDEERLSWRMDQLRALFGKDQEHLDLFCPRKPDSGKLRAELEACAGSEDGKRLRACAKAAHTSRLELRAPADVAAVAVAAGAA